MSLAKYIVVLLFLIGCKPELENTKKWNFSNKQIDIPVYYNAYDSKQYRKDNNIKCWGCAVYEEDLYFKNTESNCFLEFMPKQFTYKYELSDKVVFNEMFDYGVAARVNSSNSKWIDKQILFTEKYVKLNYEYLHIDTYHNTVRYIFPDYLLEIYFRCDPKLESNIEDFKKLINRIEKDNLFENLDITPFDKINHLN